MPILSVQMAGEGTTANGRRVPIPPQAVLLQRGPCVKATVKLAQAIAKELLERGETPPDPITGLALIDTGATSTCVDEHVASRLGLQPVDRVRIASASDTQADRNVSPITIEIEGLPYQISAPRAIGTPLSTQGLVLLIGRDALQSCTLFYNGPAGQITISV